MAILTSPHVSPLGWGDGRRKKGRLQSPLWVKMIMAVVSEVIGVPSPLTLLRPELELLGGGQGQGESVASRGLWGRGLMGRSEAWVWLSWCTPPQLTQGLAWLTFPVEGF
jgi:hypothetical protein